MSSISANTLKTQGVSAIEEALAESPEAIVSVRGKDRFVVMELAHYHYPRECELAAALAEARGDLAAERFVEDSVAVPDRSLRSPCQCARAQVPTE